MKVEIVPTSEDVITPEDLHKIGSFFSSSKRVSTRNSVVYTKVGDFVEVRLISNSRPIDLRSFNLKDPKDNRRFFEYIVEKLGFDFENYRREKETNWQ